jgi:hypothetical protein
VFTEHIQHFHRSWIFYRTKGTETPRLRLIVHHPKSFDQKVCVVLTNAWQIHMPFDDQTTTLEGFPVIVLTTVHAFE